MKISASWAILAGEEGVLTLEAAGSFDKETDQSWSDAGLAKATLDSWPSENWMTPLGLTNTADDWLQGSRSGHNIRHRLVTLLRQSIYRRLAGYDDTNPSQEGPTPFSRSCYASRRWLGGFR